MINSFVLSKDGDFKTSLSTEDLKQYVNNDDVTLWVDIQAASEDENAILTEVFDFHPLAVEDCLTVSHHPKIDKFDSYLFLVLHAVNFARKKDEELSTLEMKIFLGRNYIVTYHRKPVRSIIATRERCLRVPAKIMGEGADFLMHKVIDATVDNYLPTISLLEHEIDHIEDAVFDDSSEELLNSILAIKKDVLYLKKVIGLQRNTIYRLAHTHFSLIGKESKMYFSDIYDQLHKFVDQLEGYRDLLNGVVDMYLSMSSFNLNEIMKKLTVMMTIFMPLTLITGVYGMNFRHMPEIKTEYGYFAVLIFMGLVALLMGYYMKKKKWF